MAEFNGPPREDATWLERLPPVRSMQQILDGEVEIGINPKAHSMLSCMAYLLYEFAQNRGAYLANSDKASVPFSALTTHPTERYAFAQHYFSEFPFCDHRAEDKSVKATDGVIESW